MLASDRGRKLYFDIKFASAIFGGQLPFCFRSFKTDGTPGDIFGNQRNKTIFRRRFAVFDDAQGKFEPTHVIRRHARFCTHNLIEIS